MALPRTQRKGCLTGRQALGAVLLCALVPAAVARAQTHAADPSEPGKAPVRILSRYVFHLDAEHISSDDPRFSWDGDFGGAVDLLEYGVGRFQFLANYNVGLGDQVRRFDPNQGNYQLDGSASYRARGHEVAVVFHHLSRHLSDRPKIAAIDWNMGGVHWSRVAERAGARIETSAHLLGTIKRSFVDYSWEGAGRAAVRAPLPSAFAVIASGDVRVVGVDPTIAARGRQTGWRIEGGIRVAGTAAAVELFAAAEQRIDPYPHEVGSARWGLAGFRITTK